MNKGRFVMLTVQEIEVLTLFRLLSADDRNRAISVLSEYLETRSSAEVQFRRRPAASRRSRCR